MLDLPLWVPGLCRMFGTKASASAKLLAQKTTAWRLWACCRAMMVPRVTFDLVVLFVVKQGLSLIQVVPACGPQSHVYCVVTAACQCCFSTAVQHLAFLIARVATVATAEIRRKHTTRSSEPLFCM